MKATDLMCGDLILVNERPTRVYGVMERMGRVYDTMTNDISLKRCEPIPLTEEILEKNGLLEGISSEYWMVYSKQDEIWYFHYIGAFTDVKIGITDVHELQHALRLCGIEKEIIL